MKIAVAGTGYVGLVTGVCLAEHGHDVTCVDVDENKIQMMRRGVSPIYEEGLSELMKKNRLFISDISCEWMCLNCGHIFSGTEAPEECPVCRHDKGFFIRLTLAPYTGKI